MTRFGHWTRRLGLVACLLAVVAGCSSEGSYNIHLVFPDGEAFTSVEKVLLWAASPGAHQCYHVDNGLVDPDELVTHAKMEIEMPPAGPVVLAQVPSGIQLFIAEGRNAAGAVLVRGCQKVKVEGGETVDVEIALSWKCKPTGEEIPDNEIDDDCDGFTDECGSDLDCDDGESCTTDWCIEGACENKPLSDGLSCNDNNRCTRDDGCMEGVCQGTIIDCSFLDSICKTGQCDNQTGSCVVVNKLDGTECDDGMFCTDNDGCQAGACTGDERDCDDDDPCTTDMCVEGDGECLHTLTPKPGEEGPEGYASCGDGEDNDCDGLTDLDDPNCVSCVDASDCNDDNPCTLDDCVASQCVNNELPDGTGCEDGLYCTDDDHCEAGVCTSVPRDCSDLSGPCFVGACMESMDRCMRQLKSDGSDCDDGQFCTVGDICEEGVCDAMPNDCNDDDDCTADTCDEQSDSCNHVPQPECDTRECGVEPRCGVLCGTCPQGEFCTAEGACTELAINWATIQDGSFVMGSPESEEGRSLYNGYHGNLDETLHGVTLTRSFVMASSEITQEVFETVMGYNPSRFVGCGPNCPVEYVTWHEAALFCNKLSEGAGFPTCFECSGTEDFASCELVTVYDTPYECPGYRLPTEAEWEYAARAGTQTAFYNGGITEMECTPIDSALDDIAWYHGNADVTYEEGFDHGCQGEPRTIGSHPVGQKDPNDWGLYDMAGNVWEWLIDCSAAYPDSAVTDPVGPLDCSTAERLYRGGGLGNEPWLCRHAERAELPGCDHIQCMDIGLRPVRTLNP